MAIRTVGPTSTYSSIAAAMAFAEPNDTIQLEVGYSNETATVTQTGLTITGADSSTGIVLNLATGIPTVTLTGTAPISLYDASDANGIVGNAGDNLITVSGGADSVDGGAGTDRLIVDYRMATGAVTGNSTSNFTEAGEGGRLVTITDGTVEKFSILTGSGADTITTGAGDDVINTADGAGTVSAGQGANIIYGGRDADTITALDGGNYIDAGDGTNNVTSGNGNDTILSGTGADTIVAGGGVDAITVRGGADTVQAGDGNDRLIINYSALTTDVTGGITGGNLAAGYVGHIADTVGSSVDFQATENFTISTGTGNDTIITGGGIDNISTGAGNDSIDGGAGADLMSGGRGNDVFYVDNGGDKVFETAGQGTDVVFTSVSYALAAGQEIETMAVNPASSANVVNLNGNEFGQAISGNAGANIINGLGGNDVLNGLAGNDILDGGIGADTMLGGTGNDTFYVDNSADSVIETGGSANGVDTIFTSVSLGLGANVAVETLVTTFKAGVGAINLTGNGFDQSIGGNAGANILNGLAGNDVINGNAGNDRIFGGLGNDALTGGAGNDLFFFNSRANASTNHDVITDFSNVSGNNDTIYLENAVFTTLAAGGLGGAFASNTTGLATQADDRVIYNSATGDLFYDVNGSGAGGSILFANLTSHPVVTADDFMVV